MRVVHVYIWVKRGCEDDFLDAMRDNASRSIHEPGIVRFDVLRECEAPCRFVLVEAYRTEEAMVEHKKNRALPCVA